MRGTAGAGVSAMNTPIERLRQRHVAAGFPDNQCCVVLSCGLTWPCDTIAALDALEEGLHNLQARLDAATVLIRQAMKERHNRAIWEADHWESVCGASAGTSIDTCENCRPYREWLGGEGQ